MGKYCIALCALFFSAPLAGCGMTSSDGRLHSYAYQEEAPNRTPGYNLYREDSLDNSPAHRVNLLSRSEIIHVRHQTFLQRVKEAQALDKAAQKLGREPGSLFRQ